MATWSKIIKIEIIMFVLAKVAKASMVERYLAFLLCNIAAISPMEIWL